MKPTPIATPVKAFEAIAPATNLKPITNNLCNNIKFIYFRNESEIILRNEMK